MKKARVEIAALAALILFAAADRPSLPQGSMDLRPDLYQVGPFAPQQIESARDLGVIAVKLLVSWID